MAVVKVYDGTDWIEAAGAMGDVTGPSSATDTAIALFDGATGKLIKNSVVLVDGSGNISGLGTIDCDGNITMTRNGATIHLDSESSVTLKLDGAAGADRVIRLQTSGVDRWRIQAESTAESGSDVGSDFEINNYTDAGTLKGTVLSIDRATGNATFSGTIDGVSESALRKPPHLFGDDLSAVTARADNEMHAVYMGVAYSPYTTVSTRVNVTTAYVAGAGGVGAEIAVYTGTPVFGAGLTITRVGSQDVSTTYNSTGIADVDITTSGISVGDHLWFVYWADHGLGGAQFQLRGLLADDVQSGGVQVKTTAGAPSSNATYATTLAGASEVPAYPIWQVA